MKILSAFAVLLGSLFFFHVKTSANFTNFLRIDSAVITFSALIMSALVYGPKSVANAFRGQDWECTRNIISIFGCTAALCLGFGGINIMTNLSRPEIIGNNIGYLIVLAIYLSLVTLFLVSKSRKLS
jgi:hypothetical protein